MKLGDLSITYVELLANAVRGLGHDPKPLLQQFRIEADTLSSPDTRISIPRFMRLGYQAIEETRSPWLGLEMGRTGQPSHLGIAGLLALTSPTLKDACLAISNYELLSSYNSRGASSFVQRRDQAYLRFYSISPYNAFNLFVVDSVLSGWHKLLRDITGREKLVTAIDIEFPAPIYADKYSEYFGCPVRFNAEHNQLVINPKVLSTPVTQNCASVHEGLKRIADKELEQVRLGVSVRESVARTIGPMLDGRTPELDSVARKLNMASWTLRRRLQDEGVTFQQVLNETRQSLAESYVRETSLTLGEIAYVLGFGSAAAFQRAFKRWTGEAPGRFRELHRDSIQKTHHIK
jgi:AraC-like DNA-binding protein